MKKINSAFQFSVIIILIGLIACSTNNSGKINYTTLNAEISSTKISVDHSKAYIDTLKMYYDTVKVRKGNVYCLKYDKLYHQSDSLFMHNYNMFGDTMYGYGFIMSNYTPAIMMVDMRNGGMMNTELRGDTTMMNGYYSTMHQLRINHITYHNAIYN